MGERLRAGSTDPGRRWLEVKGDANANNAVAIDTSDYRAIKGTWTGGYDIVRLGSLP